MQRTVDLIGRDVELRRILEALRGVAEMRSPCAFRVAARSGFGKTALLASVAQRARDEGWIVAQASCHPLSSAAGLSALSAIIDCAVQSTPGAASIYTSGLETGLDSLRHGTGTSTLSSERAALRFFEALLLDHPVAIVIDDVQWIDPETASVLDRLITLNHDKRVFLLVASRLGLVDALSDLSYFQELTLHRLPSSAISQIVQFAYPQAPDSVLNAIAIFSNGIPLNAILLAEEAKRDSAQTADAVLGGLRAVIERQTESLTAKTKNFIRVLSLMSEPFEPRVLEALFHTAPTDLNPCLTEALGKFLDEDRSGFRFAHVQIKELVRATIPIELTLHQHILDVLLSFDSPSINDHQRIVEHAEACGRINIEKEWLLKLAQAAAKTQAWDLATTTYEKYFERFEPSPGSANSLYNQYGIALRALSMESKAQYVLEAAIKKSVANNNFKDLGRLVAGLAACLWTLEQHDRAWSTINKYVDLCSGSDRMDLLSFAAAMRADHLQVHEYQEILNRIDDVELSDYAKTNLARCRALLSARLGDQESAARAFEQVSLHADTTRSLQGLWYEFVGALVDIYAGKCEDVSERMNRILDRPSIDASSFASATWLGGTVDFAMGRWDRAEAKIYAAREARFGPVEQARVLGVETAIAAFRLTDSQTLMPVAALFEKVSRSDQKQISLELGAWYAAAIAFNDEHRAIAIIDAIFQTANTVLRASNMFFPLALVLAAARVKRTSILKEVATWNYDGEISRWVQAHRMLAVGFSREQIDAGSGRELLKKAADSFCRWNASFLASAARLYAGVGAKEDFDEVERLGITAAFPLRKQRRGLRPVSGLSRLTSRERDVASYVAEGLTNREIAAALFLSERTVEAHLTNIFSKLELATRTKLARWFVENRS